MEREDYLHAIYTLEKATGRARISDIAERLEVTKASASQMVTRLKKEGFLTSEAYIPLKLSAKGLRAGKDIAERHDALVEFFTTLGISKKIQEHDIHGIEHHLSLETLKKLRTVTKFLKDFHK